MAMCVRRAVMACIVTCMASLPASPRPVSAQLRPLDPLEWRALSGSGSAHGAVGGGMFTGQRASLAGTRGTLLELGTWMITYRSGRFAFEFTGTAVRRFRDDERLTDAAPAVDDTGLGMRTDAGDVRIGTVLRVAGAPDRHVLALRFGTRLPTPSDEPGLERDRTDFYATAAGRTFVASGLRLFGEAGVGIHSTIVQTYPQSDVLIYVAGAERRWNRGGLSAAIVGHDDLHRRVIRGNEDLSELRLTGWLGSTRRLEATLVRGIAEFSPEWGLLVRFGALLW